MTEGGEKTGPGAWGTPQWHVDWRDSVSSTMDLARRAAASSEPSGHVFAAREQTAGRGRSGRTWSSPPGGLYVSVLLRDPPRGLAPLFPLAGALAVRAGLQVHAPQCDVLVKWPNDVLAGRAGATGKIAGILTEGAAAGERLSWVILGFGVNLAVEETALPEGVDPPAVSLLSLGVDPPAAEDALGSILDALRAVLDAHAGRPAGLVDELRDVLAYRGREVRVVLRGDRGVVTGVLEGVSPSGDAVVATGDGELRIAAWDVKQLRSA